MISSVTIKNFQSHKLTEVSLHSGVNVIVGPSDSGKSAFLRAIRWAIKNKPGGDGIKSYWGGETEVSVSLHEPELESDPKVTRHKGKTDGYIMNGQSFKALRGEVPKEIQEVFNMTDINLQRQLDAPFLFSSSPGEVAGHFNKVANLDKIDTSTSLINSWIRELTGDIKHNRTQLTQYKEQLKEFEDLETIEQELEVLEELEKRLRLLKVTEDNLSDSISLYKRIDRSIETYSTIIQQEKQIDLVLDLIKQKAEKETERNTLYNLIDELTEIKITEDDLSLLLESEESITAVLELYKRKDEEEETKSALSEAVKDFLSISTQIKKEEAKHTRLLKEYEEGMGDVCFLCGQKIVKHKKHEK